MDECKLAILWMLSDEWRDMPVMEGEAEFARAFFRSLDELVADGFLQERGDGFEAEWRLTEKGKLARPSKRVRLPGLTIKHSW